LSRPKAADANVIEPSPIAFSPPDIREEDIQAVVEVLRSGWITSGPVSRAFENELAMASGADGALLTSSATTAMEAILRLLGIGPGDEVITTAYTYSASAAVIAHVGARIRLVDTAPGEFAPTVEAIMAMVNSRTKAVLAVDLGGVMFDHEALASELCKVGGFNPANDLQEAIGRVTVIADAAHSLGASLRGRKSGDVADFTAHSFHAVKNLTTGEGGAIVWRKVAGIDGDEIRRRAQLGIMHGQTKDALAKVQLGAWEYDIVELGHKANMPDILAALGLSQFRRYDQVVDRRHELVNVYDRARCGSRLSALRHSGSEFRSSAHLYLVLLPEPDLANRNSIIARMAEERVATNVHYKPLPLLSAYRRLGFRADEFPHAVDTFQRVISLPLHTRLTDGDAERVMASLLTHAGSAGLA
jgi:dTDP-4-amino-4,6-dideoxygalactose transaminase